MDPNATGYPTMQHNAGYPVTPQNNPQQYPYYPNQVPSFPQSKSHSQLSFGAVPLQPGPGGAMMPSGFPQHSSGPHANFSAPFAQPPVPATSMGQFFPPQASPPSGLPTTSAQSFTQTMASAPVNSMVSAQQKLASQQSQSQSPVQAAAQSSAAAREKDRVAVLLDINSMLLQEVMNLQSAGKAGAPPGQQGLQESNPSPTSDLTSDKTAQRSPEYVACMRRLQVNLAYLATIADRAKKAGGVVPPAPAIMTPPPNMPAINELYNKLNELFPRSVQGAAGASQPSPQASHGNGRPSPSSATDSLV